MTLDDLRDQLIEADARLQGVARDVLNVCAELENRRALEGSHQARQAALDATISLSQVVVARGCIQTALKRLDDATTTSGTARGDA